MKNIETEVYGNIPSSLTAHNDEDMATESQNQRT